MKITLDTFLISDTHFGHKKILIKEPIRQKELMFYNEFNNFEDLLVYRWNKVVNSKDQVFHLGDLYFDDGYKYLNKLNGNKILLVGNNDNGKKQKKAQRLERILRLDSWEILTGIKIQIKNQKEIQNIQNNINNQFKNLDNIYLNTLIIDIDSTRIMFTHFPINERKKNDKYGDVREILDYIFYISNSNINIHGHIHSRNSLNSYCVNVSVENTEFKPKKLREIICNMKNIGKLK